MFPTISTAPLHELGDRKQALARSHEDSKMILSLRMEFMLSMAQKIAKSSASSLDCTDEKDLLPCIRTFRRLFLIIQEAPLIRDVSDHEAAMLHLTMSSAGAFQEGVIVPSELLGVVALASG